MRQVRAALSALLIFWAPTAAAARYAVVIGNNLGAILETPLRYAERDAQSFAEVMVKIGDVPAENLVMLLGRGEDDIRRAILDVNVRLRNQPDSDAGDTLFVYYSGHAGADGLHLDGDAFSYAELRSMIESSAAKARVLIIDSCRSGGLTSVKGGKPAEWFPITRAFDSVPEGFVLISSSAAGEDSHESVRLAASFFTHHLINGMRGAADQNQDRRVSLHEAYGYAFTNTLRSSRSTDRLQHPTFAYDLKGRTDLVISRLDARKETGELVLPRAGLYLLMRSEAPDFVVAELAADAPGVRVQLPPGEYLIEERQPRKYLEYRSRLAPGATLELEREPRREISYAALVRKGAQDSSAAHSAALLSGVRSSVISGTGARLGGDFVYTIHLQELTLDVRARYGRNLRARLSENVTSTLHELAAAISAYRFFDAGDLSIGAGLRAELAAFHQTSGAAEGRWSLAPALGPVAAAELRLGGGLFLRGELGASTYLVRQATIAAGAEAGSDLATPLTATGALGMGWSW